MESGDLREVGLNQIGRFSGKMIFVNNMFDTNELASNAADYIPLVKQQFGPNIDDRFRLWLNDNTTHIGPTDAQSSTYLVPFMGSVQQAVRDMIAWIEDGVAPPANTSFDFTPDQGMSLEPSADERYGIQPTPIALELAPVIAEALAKIDEAVLGQQDFDPAEAERLLTIAPNGYVEFVLVPAIGAVSM